MGITHEWNGTVLTITSDSGTSSADLKGEKGDTGIRGPQGIKGKTGSVNTDNLNGYATEEYVDVKIAEAQIPTKEIDLSSFYTKSETDKLTQDIKDVTSNALKGAVSGEIVSMKDVSPITHTLEAKVRSKNLIPYPFVNSGTVTNRGVTFTNNGDGTISVNGTATGGDAVYYMFNVSNPIKLQKGAYTISGAPTGAEYGKYYITSSVMVNGVFKDYSVGEGGRTLEIEGIRALGIVVFEGITLNNLTFKPQLEAGSTATEYTPYITNLQDIEINRLGKNLISYPYYETTKSLNGVTFTDNGDGTITTNGTPTSNAYFTIHNKNKNTLFLIKGQTYTLNVLPVAGSYSTIYAYITESDGTEHFELSEDITFTANSSGYCSMSFVIAKGYVTNNLVLKPQLEIGGASTEYEPYIKPITYSINSDGSVENIESIYPTTTLLTDTLGVVIEVNYNRDLNKAFEELIQAIISLGGNI